MSRAVQEWFGNTDDQTPPPRVRLRVFDRHDGRCYLCSHKIRAGEYWECDHVTAIINGGENRENNLKPACRNCCKAKTAADVALKSDTYDMRRKDILPRKAKTRPMPGSKASGWKKTFGGQAMRRT